MLCRLTPLNCYSEDTKGLSDGSWTLLGKGSAQVFKVALAHLIKHLDFILIDAFEDVFVVERLEERRFRLSSRIVFPNVRAEHRVQEVVIRTTVELTQGLKLLRAIHLHEVVKLFVVDVVNVAVGLVVCQKLSIVLFFTLLFLSSSADRLGYLYDTISLLCWHSLP